MTSEAIAIIRAQCCAIKQVFLVLLGHVNALIHAIAATSTSWHRGPTLACSGDLVLFV